MSFRDDLKSKFETGDIITQENLYNWINNTQPYQGEKSSFPTTGDAEITYIATDENKIYRWNGTEYILLSDNATQPFILAKYSDFMSGTYTRKEGQGYVLFDDTMTNIQNVVIALDNNSSGTYEIIYPQNANPSNYSLSSVGTGENDNKLLTEEEFIKNIALTLHYDAIDGGTYYGVYNNNDNAYELVTSDSTAKINNANGHIKTIKIKCGVSTAGNYNLTIATGTITDKTVGASVTLTDNITISDVALTTSEQDEINLSLIDSTHTNGLNINSGDCLFIGILASTTTDYLKLSRGYYEKYTGQIFGLNAQDLANVTISAAGSSGAQLQNNLLIDYIIESENTINYTSILQNSSIDPIENNILVFDSAGNAKDSEISINTLNFKSWKDYSGTIISAIITEAKARNAEKIYFECGNDRFFDNFYSNNGGASVLGYFFNSGDSMTLTKNGNRYVGTYFVSEGGTSGEDCEVIFDTADGSGNTKIIIFTYTGSSAITLTNEISTGATMWEDTQVQNAKLYY